MDTGHQAPHTICLLLLFGSYSPTVFHYAQISTEELQRRTTGREEGRGDGTDVVCVRISTPIRAPYSTALLFPSSSPRGGKFSLQFIAFYIETVVQDMICLKNGNSSRIAYNNQNHTGNTSLSYSHPTQCIQ